MSRLKPCRCEIVTERGNIIESAAVKSASRSTGRLCATQIGWGAAERFRTLQKSNHFTNLTGHSLKHWAMSLPDLPPPPKGIWLVISRKIKPIFCCRMMSGSSFLDCSSRISRSDKIHQNSWQQTFYEGLWRVIVLDTYWRRNIFCSMLSLLSDWYQVIFNQAIDLRKLRFSNLENLKIFNIELWMVGQ